MNWKYIAFVIVLLACQASAIDSECQEIEDFRSSISDSYVVKDRTSYLRCWKIAIPADHVMNISLELMEFWTGQNWYCNIAHVAIKRDTDSDSNFCGIGKQSDQTFFATSDRHIQVDFYVRSSEFEHGVAFSFRLKYVILPRIIAINGIIEAGENAINWLKKKYNPLWGWKEDTPRAVTALYLSGGARFDGILLEEAMAKQLELRTALSLMWNTTSIQRLSSFINGLLVICFPPRQFYGFDLVAKLEKEVETSGYFTHPSAYLALCNAKATWPERSTLDLTRILSSESNYPFVKDIQALAIMALSCNYKRTNFSGEENLMSLYLETIKRLLSYQRPDGSFGNLHTTALISQVLMSSHQQLSASWRRTDTFRYLMKELNSTELNFLYVYATLPLLIGKTLIDIANIKCSSNPRKKEADFVYEMNNPENIRVHFSLYIGDHRDVIHSISLKVPKNSTAYSSMEIAAKLNKIYEFKVETTGNKKYIHEIAGIPNNPEELMFWMLYMKHRAADNALSEPILNPEELVLGDEDYLVMWYKTVPI